jgi:hypothetical protein
METEGPKWTPTPAMGYIVCPPNSYMEALTPPTRVAVLRDRNFKVLKGQRGPEGGVLTQQG